MRRFTITSPRFTGTAELFYNADEVLCRIDCTDTNMNAETITSFKRAIPATISELATGNAFTKETLIVEGSFRVSFEEFWKAYGKKINKVRCIPLYEKLSDADTVACHFGIKPYDKFLEKERARQKLDPENWIKLRAWENDWRNAA